MEEITYILGAGASFQSMPLVTTFVERFRNFQEFLKHLEPLDKSKMFRDHCELFIQHVENHLSFDTFFKKLFHQGKKDETKLSSEILLLYFLYE